MKRSVLAALVLMIMSFLSGCTEQVPPGTVGRINTPDGWEEKVLNPGFYTCYNRDKMYLVDITNKAFNEKMDILVGGKVNLTVNFSVRVRANTGDQEMMKKVFESVTATKTDKDTAYRISIDQLYVTFLRMKALSVPRSVFEVQPDIKTAIANSPALAIEIRKQITALAKSTPLIVDDAEITNYDWPKSITDAQEELVKIQLREDAADANVRADLKKAQGDLLVEEAKKLIELKKAEAIAESIDIIKSKLAGAPEYLMWHQIKVMGEAAMGPNNAFILYPYATDTHQVQSMIGNSNLTQMLKAKDLPK